MFSRKEISQEEADKIRELKDMVCSPGGTTIESVKTLEIEGMRSTVIKGMASCIEKSIKMSK